MRLLIQLTIFAALLALFWSFGGFQVPEIAPGDYRSSGRVSKAWLAIVALYVAGCLLLVWGSEISRFLDTDAPEIAYHIIGGIVVAAAIGWHLAMKSTVGPEAPNHALMLTAPNRRFVASLDGWPAPVCQLNPVAGR